METAPRPSRISRVDIRHRRRAQQDLSPEEIAPEQKTGKKEERASAGIDEPLLVREQRGRAVMGEAHRQFHRRAAQAASRVVTVVVNVEQTMQGGNVVGIATMPPVVPVPPPVPTAGVPTVPAVPAFPSNLNPPPVPPYPWPVEAATPTEAEPQPTVTNPASVVPTTFSGFNSTTLSSSSTQLSSSANSTSRSSTRSSASSSSSSSSTSRSSSTVTSSSASSASPTSSAGGGGGVNPQNTAPPESSPAATVASAQSGGQSSLGTPQVVGTVFGSLGGAALILALLLFLIKRHKRKQRGTLQLTGDGDTDQHQPMAQAATRSSHVTPSFLNRFSGASRSTAESSGTGERSFQRVSGRKLPSAFSEGMTSEQFDRAQGTLSGSSFYQDDKGFYSGGGIIHKDFGKEVGDTSNTGTVGRDERVMPSPARTPVVYHPEDAPPWGASHNGGGTTLSPPQTPSNPFADPAHPPRGTLGRSRLSHDGSRSSRFTENV